MSVSAWLALRLEGFLLRQKKAKGWGKELVQFEAAKART